MVHKGKGGRRGLKQQQIEAPQTNLNRFQVLEEEEEIRKINQVMERSPREKKKEEDTAQTQDSIK